MKKLAVILLAALMLVGILAGCGSTAKTEETAAAPEASTEAAPAAAEETAAEEPLKFVYVCKQLSHVWFIKEENGIKQACEELGIDYVGIDSDNNDEKCLQDIQNAFSMEADALLLCVTNQSMGPNVAKLCEENNTVLVTIDDNIVKEDGSPVAHVGMPTKEVAIAGGEWLGQQATEKGFFAEGNNVKVLGITIPTNTVFAPRIEGYKEGLMSTTPLTEDDFIIVDAADATAEYEGNMSVASPTILAHPEVTHWIIVGANDDCAIAPMDCLEEQGFDMNNVLGCGLGGYDLSIAKFKAGETNYAAIVLDPYTEGYKAVYEAYENIVNGTPLQEQILVSGKVADYSNYDNGEFYLQSELDAVK